MTCLTLDLSRADRIANATGLVVDPKTGCREIPRGGRHREAFCAGKSSRERRNFWSPTWRTLMEFVLTPSRCQVTA